ncbi:MAG: CoA pyrophosphatase [Anaerolineaceae bacterium]
MTAPISLPEDLSQRLNLMAQNPRREFMGDNGFDPKGYKPAAVLMPLLFERDEWQLLYTRRSDSVLAHQGQVSYPGGSWEVGDEDLVATALREAWEEVGIRPENVQVLGKLPALGLISHYLVTPVIGIIPWPYDLRIFPGEVARTFTVPLSWLADPDNYYTSTRIYEGKSYEIFYYQLFDGEKIWGATAHMTQEFIKLLN